MRCGRSSRPLPMSVIRSILRYGQSRPRWILPRRSSNNLSKRPKTYLPCTKSLLNKHELRCGLQAVPNACTSSVVPLLEPEGVQLSCQSYALRLCPGSSTFLEGALSLSLPELLRHEGRELSLWWDKGCGRPTVRECSAILIRRPRLKQWLRRMRAMGYVSGRKEELRSPGGNDSMHRRVRQALCGPFHRYW